MNEQRKEWVNDELMNKAPNEWGNKGQNAWINQCIKVQWTNEPMNEKWTH